MKIETFPEGLSLAEYLAKEQELVKSVEHPTLFTWIVAPTVIYGRHQIREQEVNEAYCAAHGIHIVQRQSGGGCVYADEGNLMVSYIEPSDFSKRHPVPNAYERFMILLAESLGQLGYKAVTTSHNDILVSDRKVSGTACYTTPSGTIVHACILYDVHMDALEAAITPSIAKLNKHAVQSVRQRVRNLREINDLGDISVFRARLESILVPAEPA